MSPLNIPYRVLALLIILTSCCTAFAASLAESYLKQGVALARQGKLKAAEVEFRRALDLRQDLVVAHYSLARIALQQGDYFSAVDRLRDVIALDRSYRNADRLFQEVMNVIPKVIRKRLQRNPGDARAHQMLGFVLIHLGRFGQGMRKLQQALGLDPTEATVYDDLAWGSFRLRRFKEAFRYATKAFNLSPERPSISAHHKKLFYLNNFGAGELRPDALEDFYPPPRRRIVERNRREKSGATPKSQAETPVQTSGDPFKSGDVVIDYTPADNDDHSLVDELLNKPGAAKPQDQPVSAGGDAVSSVAAAAPPTGAVRIPSPLLIVKKLESQYEKGKSELEAGHWARAAAAFRVVVAIQKDFRQARSLLKEASSLAETNEAFHKATDLLASGAFSEAYNTFRKLDPRRLKKVAGIDDVDNYLGECLYRQGKYRRAVSPLQRWLKKHPDDAVSRYMLAKSLFHEGRFDEAGQQLDLVEKADPGVLNKFPDHSSFALKLSIKRNFFYIAAAALAWLLVLFVYLAYKVRSRTSAQHFKEGFAGISRFVKEEDWKSVVDLCLKLEELKPGKVEQFRIDYNKGTAYLGLGHHRKARAICEKLLSEFPQDSVTHRLYAKVLIAERALTDEAAHEYRALLADEPNNPDCLQMLHAYHQSRDIYNEEAEKTLLSLRELLPMKSAEYSLQLCRLYLKTGRTDDTARHEFTVYLDGEPSNTDIREGLARCLVARGEWLEGIKECNKVLKLEALRKSTHELLVSCYINLDMFDEAVKRYRELARNGDGFFSSLLEDLEKRKKDHLERVKAEREEGEDVGTYYNRGVRLYSEGRLTEALSPLQAAFRSNKYRIHSAALLIKIHLRLKDQAAARKVFEQLDILEKGETDEFVLDLCYEMAAVYDSDGMKSRAMKLYRYICKKDVTYKDAFKRLENLQEELKLGAN